MIRVTEAGDGAPSAAIKGAPPKVSPARGACACAVIVAKSRGLAVQGVPFAVVLLMQF